jgi:hypothetical protein
MDSGISLAALIFGVSAGAQQILNRRCVWIFQPSDKDMFSHSATSLTTDALASSEQNGVLTNGDSKFCRGSTGEP